MNILIFTTVFYPAIGGLENVTLLLTKEFVKKGHTVKVITLQKQVATLDGIDVYCSPGFFSSIQLFLWCNIYYMPNVSLKGIWLLFFNWSKKWIISHNDFSSLNQKGFLNRIKNIVANYASLNIAVSKSVAKYLKRNSLVIHNCYDNNIFKIYKEIERTSDFVFLGRLVSQKGCHLLIEACSLLPKNFTLSIIGDGTEKKYLEELVEKLGLQSQITFYGFMKDEALARMLNRHRTMVIPSIGNEGFGIVALEGMACGCNIIAANAAGLSEAVGKLGQQFEMGNLTELTHLLENALHKNNHDLTRQTEVAEYLKEHHKSVVADRYLQQFA